VADASVAAAAGASVRGHHTVQWRLLQGACLLVPTQTTLSAFANAAVERGATRELLEAYRRSRDRTGAADLGDAVTGPIRLLVSLDRRGDAVELLGELGRTDLSDASRVTVAESAVGIDEHGLALSLLTDLGPDAKGSSARRYAAVAARVVESATSPSSDLDDLAAALVTSSDAVAVRAAVAYLLRTRSPRDVLDVVDRHVEQLPTGARGDLCRALRGAGWFSDARRIATAGGLPAGDWWLSFLAGVEAQIEESGRGLTHILGGRLQPAAAQSHRVHAIYAVRESLPATLTGYTVRTQGLVGGMIATGLRVVACTQPGFAADVGDTFVEPVRYRRLPQQLGGIAPDAAARTLAYAEALGAMIDETDPAVVHAASNWRVGCAAAVAAKRRGLPFVYEVRGLWELTRAARDPRWVDSEGFASEVRFESEVCAAADTVLAISEAIVPELVRRGADRDRIVVVPNGVDVADFRPQPRDPELEEQLGLRGHRVIGFAGSLRAFEGLADLFEAVSGLRTERSFRIVIVGDDEDAGSLHKAAHRSGLDDLVLFVGKVPHAEVARYLSLFDITPFPRRPVIVSELVSPLKPLEAMATGAAVVVSDVAALAELVEDGVTGRHFAKGDVASLAATLAELIDDVAMADSLGAAARERVVADRTWESIGGRVRSVYQDLGVDI
jgi:glycosyltransferase involved in cell wall biosynthesis